MSIFVCVSWVLSNPITYSNIIVHTLCHTYTYSMYTYVHHNGLFTGKPEPIIFFPEFSIIFTYYSLFILMLSPIILYYFSNLIVSLVKLYMAADM